jgi:hypothetical protein
MKWIGILLILSSIIWTTWWITTHDNHKGALFFLCLITVFVGLVLIFQDRVTELTVKGVGTIKAVTQQIQSDAETVTDLKERVENQSATVDLIAK